MSQFRVEKQRAEAELTLSTGETLRGCFFLSRSSATHDGPERVADVLNMEAGLFPFETPGPPPHTVLINRSHLVSVKLDGTPDVKDEARLDSGYDVATVRQVVMRLSTSARLTGTVRVYRPEGRDRLSDYARSPENFRYIETADGTFIVNAAHLVELREIAK